MCDYRFNQAFGCTDNALMSFFRHRMSWVLVCCAWFHFATAAQELPSGVLKLLVQAGVPSSAVGVVVQAVPQAGTATLVAPLVTHRANVPMNPASVMKLITTYSAFDQLGPDFTWKNRVYVDGTLEQGVLHGSLILRGSGDPKFVMERIEEMFKQVQAKGVREVRGDILLDRSVFDIPSKSAAEFDDEPLRPYNVSPDGLLVNFKALIFHFYADSITKRVHLRVEPPIAGVELQSEVTASDGECGDWRNSLKADFSDADRVHFAGRYPLSCGNRSWPVAYVAPQQYAIRVIEAMWRSSGGLLGGKVREDRLPSSAKLFHTAESLPLADIIADVNKLSNNVMAQQVFLTLAAESKGAGQVGSFLGARSNVLAWWKDRLPDVADPVLENGSGLSRQERSSAAAINSLLQLAAGGPKGHVFANSMGIAGVDGTVARMREGRGSAMVVGQAQLKTGTLREVAAIAGYVNGLNGQRYSLAAIINHPNAAAARPALDALVTWVVKRP